MKIVRSIAALAAGFMLGIVGSVLAQGLSLPNSSQTILSMLAGYVAVGQGLGQNPLAVALSGDATMNASGVVTVAKTNGSAFGTAATVNTGTSGGTVPLLNTANTWASGQLQSFAGHMASSGSAPSLSSCGTGSPSIVGDDKDGTVTMGTSATGCTITFAAAYTGTPNCTVIWQANPLAAQSYTVSNSAITTVQTSTSGNKLNYHCAAPSGG